MENKNIIIRLFEEADIIQINGLHNRIYGDNRTNEDFIWEFKDAPAGKAIYVVAVDRDNDKIIGTQCAIPINLRKTDGQVVLSAKSEDTLVDPDYRGMQLFEKMYELLFEECKKNGILYIWGFTPALKPFLKIGFEAPYSHNQSLRVVNVMTSYNYISGLNPKNKALDKIKIFTLIILSRLLALKTSFRPSSIKGMELKISSKVESDLEQLFCSIDKKGPGLFYINEDRSYIRWRINENPNHKDICSFDFYMDNELVANFIFNHHKDNVWYMIQALFNQFLSTEVQVKITRSALKKLIKSEKAALIRAWNFNTNELNKREISIYRNAGLYYIPRGVYFVWKDLNGNNELVPQNFILSRIATQGVI